MSSSCVFCGIWSAREPASIVYRDADLLAFMSNAPVNPGHLLIIPGTHTPSLADLDPRLAGRTMAIARELAAALRESALRCEGINLFLADGTAASQLVPHLHLHVIPRFTADSFKLNEKGGVTTWERMPARAELDRTADSVRIALHARAAG